MRTCVLISLLLWASSGALRAQETTAPAPQPQENVQPTASSVVLKEGTEVHLKLAQELTGRAAVVGDPVELILAEDLRADGAVVVRQGSRVLGTVMEGKESEKKRQHAKSLRLRVDFLKAGERQIPLRGEKAGVGKREKGKMVAGTAALGLTGLFLTMGKKYKIPAGTPVTAYVAEDVELPPLK